MKRILISIAFAAGLSVAQNGGEGLPNLLHHLGLFNRQSMMEEIAASITQYNKNSAGFYATAGESHEGLAVIPASQLLKRRLFQDINLLKSDGLVMVFDLDHVRPAEIRLLNRSTAMARTGETWAVSLQDLRTRKPIFNVKAVEVEVRYLLQYEVDPLGRKRWIVHEVDVYPTDTVVPELNVRRVL